MSCQTLFIFPCPKDPSDVLDYQADLSEFLGADTISSYTLSCSQVDLVASAIDSTGKKINFRLQGGANRVKAGIELTATLTTGQIVQRSAKLAIKER